MKYLDRKEMRDRIAFLNGLVGMKQAELARHETSYALKQANKFQELADEYQAKADQWEDKHESFDTAELNESINRHLSERARIVFLLSERGKPIFKLLDGVSPRFHDRFLIAVMSSASSDDNASENLSNLLRDILMEGK